MPDFGAKMEPNFKNRRFIVSNIAGKVSKNNTLILEPKGTKAPRCDAIWASRVPDKAKKLVVVITPYRPMQARHLK